MAKSDVADELRAILDAGDGRTLIEMREAEPHYDIVVTEATPTSDGTASSIGFGDHWGTVLSGRSDVKAGDVVTIWDGSTEPGFGTRHGWALNGELVEWLTPLERIAKRVQWLADHDRSQRERMEHGAEERAIKYAGLPEPLKARIDRFAAASPDFWMNGDYELFCCTEAAKIADYLRPRVDAGADPVEVVKAFYDDGDDQGQCGVDDGHSGNTFGGACGLARALLSGESV